MKQMRGIACVKWLPGKLEEWKRLTAEGMHIVRIALSDEPATAR